MTVADALEAVSIDENAVVVKQGEPGNDFFIIVDGSAVVSTVSIYLLPVIASFSTRMLHKYSSLKSHKR